VVKGKEKPDEPQQPQQSKEPLPPPEEPEEKDGTVSDANVDGNDDEVAIDTKDTMNNKAKDEDAIQITDGDGNVVKEK